MSKNPKVFISYSHDSQTHKDWVKDLAMQIRDSGIDVILDQWNLHLGDDVTFFMDNAVGMSHRVLMICTDQYIEKANKGRGGVGYERIIVTGELITDLGTNKFIPVVRNVQSKIKTPASLATRLYIDFSDDLEYENNLEKLIQEIYRSSNLEPKIKKKA